MRDTRWRRARGIRCLKYFVIHDDQIQQMIDEGSLSPNERNDHDAILRELYDVVDRKYPPPDSIFSE
jgi:hypothetical protein